VIFCTETLPLKPIPKFLLGVILNFPVDCSQQQIRLRQKLRDFVGNRHCCKEKGSADNPAHAHEGRSNIINNDVDIIVIICTF